MQQSKTPPAGSRIIVTVIGQDQVGIIARVATALADARANILDISQSVMAEFFVMIMMVDIAGAGITVDELRRRLATVAEAMGLKIEVQHEDVFKYMHRI